MTMPLSIDSPAFLPSGPIPRRHTCEGPDRSPPLAWRGAPPGTKSFALIVDDPDAPDPAAPTRVWVHWVVVDLPADSDGLPENASREGLPRGVREGKNDWKQLGWRGPCPPIGRHRYFFKLYALDTLLPGLNEPTKAELEHAMGGHVLGRAELMGTCEKGAGGRSGGAR
jgi:Raf kinase inhibitor-like YbhB/YbcL family protein